MYMYVEFPMFFFVNCTEHAMLYRIDDVFDPIEGIKSKC